MKYLKKYETQRYNENRFYWAFECDDFKVHKITYGPNKDKISFRHYDKSNGNYSIKGSAILGCSLVVDTKYEKDEKLRGIEIGGNKYRKVYPRSIEIIIRNFIVNEHGEDYYKQVKSFEIRDLFHTFGDIFSSIMEQANTIGDVIDGLKDLKGKMIKYLEENFKKWELENNVKKYNI